MSRWISSLIGCLCLCLGCAQLAAATWECEALSVTGGEVVRDPACSAGAAIRVALDRAANGQEITIEFPQPLPAGKHRLLLRVRLEPADAYADSFVIAVGTEAASVMPTDQADPRDSDFRLWELTVTCRRPQEALVITVHRPSTREAKTAAIILDCLSVEDRPDRVCIESMRPNKVLYAPQEQAQCTMTLFNSASTDQVRTVRALEVLDVDTQREVGTVQVAVPASGAASADLGWNVGTEAYGREIRLQLLDAHGQVVDWQSDYFSVADNVWKVAMRAPHGPHMTDPDSVHCPYKTDQSWRAFLAAFPEQIHASYGNFSEMFAWAPDDAFDMTPKQERWISGQGGYQHNRSRIIEFNLMLTAQGVWPITYAKSAASGPPSFDFMRRHPELGVSRYQCQFDQQKIRDWDTQVPGKDKTVFYDWMSLVLNIVDPRVVDLAINEILDSSDMFGWRGARFDDHYTLWGRPYDPISTRNMQRIFDLGTRRHPGFTWGFNYLTMGTTCVWPGKPLADVPWRQPSAPGQVDDPHEPRWETMPPIYPELQIACSHHAFIMNEEARGAQTGTYTNYTRLLVHEARLVRSLGGEYGPIPFDASPGSTFDGAYPAILRIAAGAHTYGAMWGNQVFRQFLTRYSGLIYGEDHAALTDPESLLSIGASGGVWWRCFASSWAAGPRQRILVHLLGAPAKDQINQNRSGVVTKITHVTLAYTGPGTITRAWELSPAITGFIRPLTCRSNQMTPSDFHLWTMVLLEISGGTP